MKTSYKAGDWNVICEKCGMKRKASTMRLNFYEQLVCYPECWEWQHPQELVEGIEDDQTVPIARPDIVSTQGSTTVKVAGIKGDTSIDVNSITGISDGDNISIILDNGTSFQTLVSGAPAGDTITFIEGTELPYAASADNTVYLPCINDYTTITATGISATGL